MFKKRHIKKEHQECWNEKKIFSPLRLISFIVFFKMVLIVFWRTWENIKFSASAPFLGHTASETLFFLGSVIPMSGIKLFLSILLTVLKCLLYYLLAAAIILKPDTFQLKQSPWSFITFQIIEIKHYKLFILSLLFVPTVNGVVTFLYTFSHVIISIFVQLSWMVHW